MTKLTYTSESAREAIRKTLSQIQRPEGAHIGGYKIGEHHVQYLAVWISIVIEDGRGNEAWLDQHFLAIKRRLHDTFAQQGRDH